MLGHIWTNREETYELKFRFETEFKKRFNYINNTTETEFNTLHQHVSLEEIYEQFLEIEQMEHVRINEMTPDSKKAAKRIGSNKKSVLAISKLISPDQKAKKNDQIENKKKSTGQIH